MFLGYQNNERGEEFIAIASNTREELENNPFIKYTRIEESNKDWQLVNGVYRIGGETVEEQNEAIRQTRESLYRATSDYLKADYDEAVARGSDNVEELKKAWLAAKDAVRAAHPYVKKSSSNDLQPDQAENQTTTDAEEGASESDVAEPAATNTLPEQDISSWTGV